MAGKTKGGSTRIDIATLLGLAVAMAGVVGGFMEEGGKFHQILKPTAAMIVFGGTLGATLVGTPINVMLRAMARIKDLLFESKQEPAALIEEVVEFATKARKNGIVSLEDDVSRVQDPFLRKALGLAVDGADLQEVRTMMELEIEVAEHEMEKEAKVFESAGGYAPTIGILGAVLGLIQVMQHIADPSEVGSGIAVAFVATIYGVGSANILFLPAGQKIKARARAEAQRRELMLEGVTSIVEGMNPKLIRSKLEAYVTAEKPKAKAKAKPGTADAPETTQAA